MFNFLPSKANYYFTYFFPTLFLIVEKIRNINKACVVCSLYVEHAYDIFRTGYLFFLNQSKIFEYLGGFLHGLYIYIKLKRTSLKKYLCILSLFKIWDRFLKIEFPGQNIQAFDV